MTDDQLMAAVAATLVARTVDHLTEGGKAAFRALGRLVRGRLAGRPGGQETLTAAETNPTDQAAQQSLRGLLGRIAAEDPEFAATVRTIGQELGLSAGRTESPVSNHVSGSVGGNVVQARDVRGGISFG